MDGHPVCPPFAEWNKPIACEEGLYTLAMLDCNNLGACLYDCLGLGLITSQHTDVLGVPCGG